MRACGRLLAAGCLLALLTRGIAHAQRVRREASFEGGYTRVHQEGFAASDAGSLAASLACTAPTRAWEASGSLLFAPGGGAIAHGLLSGAQRLWERNALAFDLGGTASAIVSTDLPSAAHGSLVARGSYDTGAAELWSSFQGGLLSHDAPVRGSAVVEAGAARRVALRPASTLRIGGALSYVWTYVDIGGFADGRGIALPSRYGELGTFGELRGPAGALTLAAGLRFGEEGEDLTQGYVLAEAELKLTRAIALVFGGGSQLGDPTRGIGAARFASAGIRLSTSRARTETAPLTAVVRVSVVREERADGDVAIIRVIAPTASRVEVMGDFTDWAPIPLERRDGTWEVARPIPPGSHRILVRISGGEWQSPANLPRISDDFGGKVGLLVVP